MLLSGVYTCMYMINRTSCRCRRTIPLYWKSRSHGLHTCHAIMNTFKAYFFSDSALLACRYRFNTSEIFTYHHTYVAVIPLFSKVQHIMNKKDSKSLLQNKPWAISQYPWSKVPPAVSTSSMEELYCQLIGKILRYHYKSLWQPLTKPRPLQQLLQPQLTTAKKVSYCLYLRLIKVMVAILLPGCLNQYRVCGCKIVRKF